MICPSAVPTRCLCGEPNIVRAGSATANSTPWLCGAFSNEDMTMKTPTPSERIGPLSEFDLGPAGVGSWVRHPPAVAKTTSRVKLRYVTTGEVAEYLSVDAREILNSSPHYERVEADDTTPEAA